MRDRTAHPVRNRAVNDGLPQLFVSASLILKEILKNLAVRHLLLLLSSSLSRFDTLNWRRGAQWFEGAISASTEGLVLARYAAQRQWYRAQFKSFILREGLQTTYFEWLRSE